MRQVWRLCDQVLQPALTVRQPRAAAGLNGAEHPDVAPRIRLAQVAARLWGVLQTQETSGTTILMGVSASTGTVKMT